MESHWMTIKKRQTGSDLHFSKTTLIAVIIIAKTLSILAFTGFSDNPTSFHLPLNSMRCIYNISFYRSCLQLGNLCSYYYTLMEDGLDQSKTFTRCLCTASRVRMFHGSVWTCHQVISKEMLKNLYSKCDLQWRCKSLRPGSPWAAHPSWHMTSLLQQRVVMALCLPVHTGAVTRMSSRALLQEDFLALTHPPLSIFSSQTSWREDPP